MLIKLKRKHIDKGIPCSGVSCPIALALEENIDKINNFLDREDERPLIGIFPKIVYIGDYKFEPSAGVRNWTKIFDGNREEAKVTNLYLTKNTISLLEEVKEPCK